MEVEPSVDAMLRSLTDIFPSVFFVTGYRRPGMREFLDLALPASKPAYGVFLLSSPVDGTVFEIGFAGSPGGDGRVGGPDLKALLRERDSGRESGPVWAETQYRMVLTDDRLHPPAAAALLIQSHVREFGHVPLLNGLRRAA